MNIEQLQENESVKQAKEFIKDNLNSYSFELYQNHSTFGNKFEFTIRTLNGDIDRAIHDLGAGVFGDDKGVYYNLEAVVLWLYYEELMYKQVRLQYLTELKERKQRLMINKEEFPKYLSGELV